MTSPTFARKTAFKWWALALTVLGAVGAGTALYVRHSPGREAWDPSGLVSPTRGIDPSWRPDGAAIIYRSSCWQTPDDWVSRGGPDELQLWDLNTAQAKSTYVAQADRAELFWPSLGSDHRHVYAVATWLWPDQQGKRPAIPRWRHFSGKQLWRIDMDTGRARSLWSLGNALFARWDPIRRQAMAAIYHEPREGKAGSRPQASFALVSAAGDIVQQTAPVPQAFLLGQCDLLDDSTVVFCATDETEASGPRAPSAMYLASIDLRKGVIGRLAPSVRDIIYSFVLSHNKGRVAYVLGAPRATRCRLVVRSLGGADEQPLATDARPDSDVGWSPDDRYIAYASAADGKIRIVAVPERLGKGNG